MILYDDIEQVLLVTEDILPIPDTIQTWENWGKVTLTDSDGYEQAIGQHVMVRGTKENIAKWLCQYDKVWLIKPGTWPMAKEFVEVTVAESGDELSK